MIKNEVRLEYIMKRSVTTITAETCHTATLSQIDL